MLISGYYEKTLIKDQKTGYTIFSLKPIGSTLDFINHYPQLKHLKNNAQNKQLSFV